MFSSPLSNSRLRRCAHLLAMACALIAFWMVVPICFARPTDWESPVGSRMSFGMDLLGFGPWVPQVDWHVSLFSSLSLGTSLLLLRLRDMNREIAAQEIDRLATERVRMAVDLIPDGIVIVNDQGKILVANQAFCFCMDQPLDGLVGKNVQDIPWQSDPVAERVFEAAARTIAAEDATLASADGLAPRNGVPGRSELGELQDDVELESELASLPPPIPDSAPLADSLLAFEDANKREKSKAELIEMLDLLKSSREEICRQNEQLRTLVTRDPLTGCLNRRSFFELFEQHWAVHKRDGRTLSGVMVDIDHFKSINDNYLHATGDLVLKGVAKCLRDCVREGHVVARYGGEEFCILMPDTALENAAKAAERLRVTVAGLEIEGLKITASFGVSCSAQGAESPAAMLEQADKCLYVAKRNGRNQVVRFDQLDAATKSPSRAPSAPRDLPEPASLVPFPAVAALVSALAYRDSETAAHSHRVADLAADMTARLKLPMTEAYLIEIAAMLHDIGKIGVPDAVLLKPGPLNADEWTIMQKHDRVGSEIVESSFRCPALSDVVRSYHLPFGGDPMAPHQPSGKNIPVGARILSICDAFDSMTSDRLYRKGRTNFEACHELRRCAGSQFDPELVETLIQLLRESRNPPCDGASLSIECSLQVGTQLEQLTLAVDAQDFVRVGALAQRLETTARRYHADTLAEAAAQLAKTAEREPQLDAIIETTRTLLEICRVARSVHIPQADANA